MVHPAGPTPMRLYDPKGILRSSLSLRRPPAYICALVVIESDSLWFFLFDSQREVPLTSCSPFHLD